MSTVLKNFETAVAVDPSSRTALVASLKTLLGMLAQTRKKNDPLAGLPTEWRDALKDPDNRDRIIGRWVTTFKKDDPDEVDTCRSMVESLGIILREAWPDMTKPAPGSVPAGARPGVRPGVGARPKVEPSPEPEPQVQQPAAPVTEPAGIVLSNVPSARPAPHEGRAERPREVQVLLTEPHPSPEDQDDMLNWLSAEPPGRFGWGMQYPDGILRANDVMRLQSNYASSPEKFLETTIAADRNKLHQVLPFESGVSYGDVLMAAFPAKVTPDLLPFMQEMAIRAMKLLSPEKAEIRLKAHGMPTFSEDSLKLFASALSAIERMQDMPGGKSLMTDNPSIPLGDFTPSTGYSPEAVMGSIMFTHMIGRPLDESAVFVLGGLAAACAVETPDRYWEDQRALDIADQFMTKPAQAFELALSVSQNPMDVSKSPDYSP